jgi:peptidoglycan-N-acetylglucosamine deacetylase
MKQSALDSKKTYSKKTYSRNVFQQRRNLIYLVAAAVGSTAGILVGEKPSPLDRTPVMSSPFFNSRPTPVLVGQMLTQPDKPLQQLNLSLKKEIQTRIIQHGVTFTAPLQFQGKIVNRVSTNRKVIALTFDDGPWNTTPQVLEILRANQISATFFMVGRHLQAYPQVAKQVVAEGHAVGNHTWNHRYGRYSPVAAAAEIQRTNDLLYQVSGARTTLFRPPAGLLNNGLAGYAQSQQGTVIMWSNDSLDWRSPLPQTITSNVLKNAQTGGIVLLHDGGGDRSRTIAALPGIIRELKKQGYEFVTVPQLLEIKDQELQAKKG